MRYFFFSYARENADDLLTKFFEDLRKEVMDLVVCNEDAAAFLDTNQGGGVEWEKNIPGALMTSKVMICVHSPAYFQKPYCGKEVQVFLQRRKKYMDKNPGMTPTNIIPVTWVPVKDEIPLTLPKFNLTLPKFSPALSQTSVRDFNQEYDKEGLKFMLESGLGNNDRKQWYVTFKRTLAREIRDAGAHFPFDETDDPGDFAVSMPGVRDAFSALPPATVTDLKEMKLGPKSATFVYVGSPDWEWHSKAPFTPPRQNAAGFVSAAIAERNDLESQKIPLDVPSLDAFAALEKLRDGNGPVVVLVERKTMLEDAYREWLRTYDEKKYPNCTTVVVGASGVPDKTVEQAFAGVRGARPALFFHPISDADTLGRAVETSLTTLHDILINSSPMKRDAAPTNYVSLPSVPTPGPR